MYPPFFFSTPAQVHPVRTCSRPHPAKILHLFIAVNEPKFQPLSDDDDDDKCEAAARTDETHTPRERFDDLMHLTI